jgi:hypothetical protein
MRLEVLTYLWEEMGPGHYSFLFSPKINYFIGISPMMKDGCPRVGSPTWSSQ